MEMLCESWVNLYFNRSILNSDMHETINKFGFLKVKFISLIPVNALTNNEFCFHFGDNHYQNHCLLIHTYTWTQSSLTSQSKDKTFLSRKCIWNIFCRMTAILLMPWCVKMFLNVWNMDTNFWQDVSLIPVSPRTDHPFSWCHCNNVKWVSWHFKSLATWLFINSLLRLTAIKSTKLHITGPLWGESTSHWWIPLTKGQ